VIVTSSNTVRVSVSKELTNSIKAELAVFDNSGTRGRCLEQVYAYLLTIPATCVEAERAISAAEVHATKVRSRLSDTSLDMLCFLRAHYQQYLLARKNNEKIVWAV